MTNEITPKEWVLPNRIGYNEKVYKNFNPELYSTKIDKAKCKCEEDVCDLVEDAKISLFPQQRFIFNSIARIEVRYYIMNWVLVSLELLLQPQKVILIKKRYLF